MAPRLPPGPGDFPYTSASMPVTRAGTIDTYVIVPDVLSPAGCAAVIEAARSGPPWCRRPGRSDVAFIPTHGRMPDQWAGAVDAVLATWRAAATIDGLPRVPPDMTGTMNVQHYGPGDCFPPHRDGWRAPDSYCLDAVIGLSDPDDHDGGEFCSPGRDPLKIPQGAAVIVPGHVLHEVTEVTAGERWVLTAMMTSPPGLCHGVPESPVTPLV